MTKTTPFYSIAIDGPAGSGKSSVAKMLASELHWIHISTGNMFRAYAWYLSSLNIDDHDDVQICEHLNDIDIHLQDDFVHIYNYQTKQLLDVTKLIANPTIAAYASQIAHNPCVRQKLLVCQQKIASENNVIMDGRDIGSVVLPNATLKIYLDASIQARTKRRIQELLESNPNQHYDYQNIYAGIEKRDYDDMHRAIAPLVCVPDAIVINNDNLSLEGTKQTILDYLKKHISQK